MSISRLCVVLVMSTYAFSAEAVLYSCLDATTGKKIMRDSPCESSEKEYSPPVTSITRSVGATRPTRPWYEEATAEYDPIERLLINLSDRFRSSGTRAGSVLAGDCLNLLVRYKLSKSGSGIKSIQQAASDPLGKMLLDNVEARVTSHKKSRSRNTGKAAVDSISTLIDYLSGTTTPQAKEQKIEVNKQGIYDPAQTYRGVKERDGYSELRNMRGEVLRGHVEDGVLYDEKGKAHLLAPE